MAKRWLLAAAASAACVGAVVAVWLDPPPNAGDVEPKALSPHRQATPNPNMDATWVFRPKTLHELAKRAPNAVVATVTGVNSGPTLADGSEAHPDSGLETQRISFRTSDNFSGQMPAEFQLFKVGGSQAYMEGDPPYVVGEEYLLFVEKRVNGSGSIEPGTYVPVAPDGRLKVQQGKVKPVIEGPLGDKLRGQALAEIKRAVREPQSGA
jgi:hypothetical protein